MNTRPLIKILPLAALLSWPVAVSAHDANFVHGHIDPAPNPAATQTTPQAQTYESAPASMAAPARVYDGTPSKTVSQYSRTTSSQNVINPAYGGQFAADNHRYVHTYAVKTSVEQALEELREEEDALRRRDYKNNTFWIDSYRDEYRKDIGELKEIEGQLQAMIDDQMNDYLELKQPGGKPSEWRVGPYNKFLKPEDLKEYFRPKSQRTTYPASKTEDPKTPKVKKSKKDKLKGILEYFRPKSRK